MRPRAARRTMALPLAAALAGHGMAAALLLATPPRHLPPAADPLAVTVLAEAAPAETPSPGLADLDEPSPPGSVTWPEPAPARPAPPPRPAAVRPPRPAAVASTAPAAPALTSVSPDAISAWHTALSAWIERHRRYPPAARFRHEEGVVQLRFNLDPAGRVLHVALEGSSGSSALDAAAVALFAGATLPPPPPALPPDQRNITLPIRYRLQ